jgi:hypothetical protein
MPPAKSVTLTITLDHLEYKIVRDFARQQCPGRRDLSLALRTILRDWYGLRMIAEMQAGRRPANPYPGGPDLHVRVVGTIAIPD